MYTMILHDEENQCVQIYRGMISPIVEGNKVTWENGEVIADSPFIVVEGDYETETGEDIASLMPQDIKGNLLSETKRLKEELSATQTILNDMLLGGMML